MSALGRYGEVLRTPGAGLPALAALIGRLPIGMTSLAVLLLARHATDSFTVAGALVATVTLTQAAVAPRLGRLADTRGARPVLLVCGVLHPVSAVLLAASLLSDSPTALAFPAGALLGASIPPLSPCMRALWSRMLTSPSQRQAAFSLEAITVELVFVLGPTLAGILSAAGSPAAAVLLSAGTGGAGALLFASTHAAQVRPAHPDDAPHSGRSVLRIRGLQVLAACAYLQITAFALMEVSVVGSTTAAGTPGLAGPLLGLWAGGSIAGGLIWGARHREGDPARQYAVICTLLGLGLAPVALTDAPLLLAPLLVLAGVSIAPASTVASGLVSLTTPATRQTEAFTWLFTAAGAGAATGAALAGLLVDASGPRAAALAAGAVGLLGGLVAHLGRTALNRPTDSLAPSSR